MIWTLPAEIIQHIAPSVTITIQSPDSGIFVNNLELYLGNCDGCGLVGLSYQLFLLPMYSDNNTQTGLDTFVTFNNPLTLVPNNHTANNSSVDLLNSCRCSLDSKITFNN